MYDFVVLGLVLVPCGAVGAVVGKQRGQGGLGFLLALFLGPIGVLVAALLPDAQKNGRR
jgi:hypothetical protein